jgi:hypothetical protein
MFIATLSGTKIKFSWLVGRALVEQEKSIIASFKQALDWYTCTVLMQIFNTCNSHDSVVVLCML